MKTERLVQELKQADTILPQDILKDTNLEQLVIELKSIFEKNRAELESDTRFKNNFTELVNYIYITMLEKKPRERDKKLFSERLIDFLLMPSPAV